MQVASKQFPVLVRSGIGDADSPIGCPPRLQLNSSAPMPGCQSDPLLNGSSTEQRLLIQGLAEHIVHGMLSCTPLPERIYI